MNKYRVEELVPIAVKICGKKENVTDVRNHMAAFGATVIMSGLCPALSYYRKDSEKTEINRKVYDLLAEMCKDPKSGFATRYSANGDLLKVAIDTYTDRRDRYEDLTNEILEYVVAYKLALDAFSKDGD